ncbi:MAG: thymidine phosphorylase, partial [Bdellovibrionota bacterium]
PQDPAAGVELHARLGENVSAGEPLFTIHAESPGELSYALEYAERHPEKIVAVGES